MIDCRLIIAGQQVADTGAELLAGEPTALADLSVTWGRDTTVDQPDAATCSVTLTDRPATGTAFTDTVWIGAPVEIHAAGDISTGAGVNTMTDASFELETVGPVPKPPAATRFYVFGGSAADVVTDSHHGVRAVLVPRSTSATTAINVAPAKYSTDPAAWDAIPRARTGESWTIRTWYRTRSPGGIIRAAGKDSPEYGSLSLSITNTATVIADGAWHEFTASFLVPPQWDQLWVGLYVAPGVPPAWQDMPAGQSWTATPDTWRMYGALLIDEVATIAPSSGLDRDVLMFAGRVTDLAVRIDDTGRHVEVIAADQLAELGNRWIGQLPWPSETVPARVNRILAAVGVTAQVIIDPVFQPMVVAPKDVDNQSAATLLLELASGIDAVFWTAAHVTLGAYIRLLDLATVPGAGTVLDGCDVIREPIEWRLDVSDVITRVDVTWQNTTTTPPTETTVTVDNAAAIAIHGIRRHGVQTPLTSSAAATTIGNRILARSSAAKWRASEVARDLGFIPDRTAAESAALLDLMDGTIRLDRHVQVTDVADWITTDVAGTLTGGRYQYGPDGWTLELTIAP